ncbi:MAG: hypothetical protein ACE5FU_05690 [Nitrospinota bacterium]
MLDEFGEQHSGFVTITRKPVTLKPGQKSRVSLQFTLPDDFEPCSHFRTRHQLYNASLKIDIYTTSKSDRKKTSDS